MSEPVEPQPEPQGPPADIEPGMLTFVVKEDLTPHETRIVVQPQPEPKQD